MRHRVAVTGMGAVHPLGCSARALVQGLLEGRSGIGPITLFDPAELPTRIAAEAAWDGPPIEGDRKIAFVERAAEEAWQQACAVGSRPIGEDAAASLGVGLELFDMPDLVTQWTGGPTPRTTPERLRWLQTPADLSVHLLSARFGLARPPLVHVSACAAGADALGAAMHLIASGRRRWMLAGGTDSMINPLGVAGFCRLRATSEDNDGPQRASRPFDARRNGFVLGEGAGVLVLERLQDARERGATVLAELVGYGRSFDAHGISEPDPEGAGAALAMTRALRDADLSPDQIDAVSAHGTSTPKNDPMETRALVRALGGRAAEIPISAPKSMIGHLISAAGAVEAIAAIGCLGAGRVHPTVNLETPDPSCHLDYVPGVARDWPQRYVLSSSFAFGGHNAALIFRHPEEDP